MGLIREAVDYREPYLKIPKGFLAGEWYPWMSSSLWRWAFTRIQGNACFQPGGRRIKGKRQYLERGEVALSAEEVARWVPEISVDEAQQLLDALAEHGLMEWGDQITEKGLRVAKLIPYWGDVWTRKSRGGRRRRAKSDPDLEGSPQDFHGPITEEDLEKIERGEAVPMSREMLKKVLDREAAMTSDVENEEDEPEPERGRTSKGGTTGGEEGEGDRPPPERDKSLSPPPKEMMSNLVEHFAAYMAPQDRGVIPLSRKERSALRQLVRELWTTYQGDADRVRDYAVQARRWADSRGAAQRMSPEYLRVSQPSIESFRTRTLADERRYQQMQAETERQRREDDADRAYREWRARMRLKWEEIGQPARKKIQRAVFLEIPKADSAEAEKLLSMAREERMLEVLGEKRADPSPRRRNAE